MMLQTVQELLDYDPRTGVFSWRVSRGSRRAGAVAGKIDPRGYILIKISGVGYYAHRLAWLHVSGAWPECGIDHKDGDKGNNAIANLRPATPSENGGNMHRHRDNQTGFKGVMVNPQCRSRPYHARIMVNGKRIHLGYHKTAALAHAAYVKAAQIFFSEFARSM